MMKIQNAAGKQAARSANSEPPVCKSSKDAANQYTMVPFKENEIFVITHYWLTHKFQQVLRGRRQDKIMISSLLESRLDLGVSDLDPNSVASSDNDNTLEFIDID